MLLNNFELITGTPPIMSKITSVVNNSLINEDRLLQAHRLARVVFEPEVPESEYGVVPPKHRNMGLSLWRERLNIPHANIVCVMDTSATADNDPNTPTQTQQHSQTASSTIEPTETASMLGMFLNYPRSRNGLDSYHIFISAVHPLARGRGLFKVLLNATKDHAQSAGYTTLTVSTFPDQFERMFAILSKEESGWEVIEWENEAEKGNRKVVMKMIIG